MIVAESQILHLTHHSQKLFAGRDWGRCRASPRTAFDSGLGCRRILSDINQQDLQRGLGMLLMDLVLYVVLEGKASHRAATGHESMVLLSLRRVRFWCILL